MLFLAASREILLRRLLGGRCLIRRRRGICGGLGGRAFSVSLFLSSEMRGKGVLHTLKLAEYGIPIGRFANTASARFSSGFLKARLWLIS